MRGAQGCQAGGKIGEVMGRVCGNEKIDRRKAGGGERRMTV